MGTPKKDSRSYLIRERNNQKVYAVIYGARNHASRAFSSYLAEHGYSLIIIDSDQNSLNSAEKHVHKDFENVSIMKIKMEEFDEAEALRVVKQLNKFGEVIKGLVITKNVMLNEQNSKKFEGLNFDEIHQIMHDNNEMMVGLINVLIKPIKKSGNGFIINLRNEKYQSEDDAIYWDLLYHCSSKFSTFFIDCIRKAESKIEVEKINQSKSPKIHMINVSVNYDNIKKDEEKRKLCAKTFNYLGICDSLDY